MQIILIPYVKNKKLAKKKREEKTLLKVLNLIILWDTGSYKIR